MGLADVKVVEVSASIEKVIPVASFDTAVGVTADGGVGSFGYEKHGIRLVEFPFKELSVAGFDRLY
jgi:hypothetical protein